MPFCRECFYDLRELPGGNCPECGHLFDPSDPSSTLQSPRRAPSIFSLFAGFVLIQLFLLAALGLAGKWWIYVDIPSLLIVAAFVIGGLLMSHGVRATFRAVGYVFIPQTAVDNEDLLMSVRLFRRAGHLSWGGAVVGYFIGAAAMMSDMSDPASIGAGLAVSFIAPLYGSILAELLFFPLSDAVISRSRLPERMVPRYEPVGWMPKLVGVICMLGSAGLIYSLLHTW